MALWDIITGPAKGVFEVIRGTLDDVITSDEERSAAKAKLLEIELNFQRDLLNAESEIVKAGRDAVVAEAKGESWLQRSWRPITMLSFVFIVINNYILVPYVTAFGGDVPKLEIPEQMWGLITVGLGGYVVGRSAEKVTKNWRNGGNST